MFYSTQPNHPVISFTFVYGWHIQEYIRRYEYLFKDSLEHK